MSEPDPAPTALLKSHQNTTFGDSLYDLVNQLEEDSNRLHSIPEFCRKFQVKRRRLYDVMNVFTATGCATRIGNDKFDWHGRASSIPHLKEASNRLDIHNRDKSLSQLFPPDNCVGLPSLTVSFILLFGALHMTILDLREVSCFFSRNTIRYKSTLCKLYQIALILGSLGIVEKTTNACEVRIQSPFGVDLQEPDNGNPVFLDTLLNRPAKNGDSISRRRIEYQQWSKNAPRMHNSDE
jgi:hypothetical protein